MFFSMALAPARADKLMQRFKYWILHNPKYLMLLLSEHDDDNLHLITVELMLNVAKAGGLDCDLYCVTEVRVQSAVFSFTSKFSYSFTSE